MMCALVAWLLFAAPVVKPVAAVMTAPAARWADVELRFQRGKLSLVAVTLGSFDKPTALRRFRGRFEARVLEGKKLVESVQFDFPLLGAAESSDTAVENRAVAERLRAGVTTTATVRVPIYDRADGLEIYDRELRTTLPVALPLKAPAEAAPSDRAGSPRAP